MSFQERRAAVSLLCTIVVTIAYYTVIFQRAQAAAMDDYAFWGWAVLLLVPVLVLAKILFTIVFTIVNVVVTRREEPDIVDEFDRMVDLKATRNFYHVFIAGFFLSMAVLAAGGPPQAMFAVLMFAIFAAGMVIDVSQIYYYRRGVQP